MPPRFCCCDVCPIGDDNFDRPDSALPGPNWHIISGTGAIVSNKIEVSGNVATTLCHPSTYQLGSHIATFKLVNVRTVTYYEVGVGHPVSSTWRVEFIPSDIDTINAKILVRVYGSEGWQEQSVPWPVEGGLSANVITANVCYEPGALIRGGIGIVPQVDNHIDLQGWEDNCYNVSGTNVGNFFFLEGHFDDFSFETTILDNWDCPICGCFCFKRAGGAKDWNGYPPVLYLNLELTAGDCASLDGLSIPMYQGLASPTYYSQKQAWFSEVLSCGGFNYTFILECSPIVKDGNNWFNYLSLRIGDGSYFSSNVIFEWAVVDNGISTKFPSFGLSTCDPLSLVYEDLKIKSFVAPCGPMGEMGHVPFCCVGGCYPSPPDIRLRVTVTE